MTWRDLLEQWPLLDQDLQDVGIDVRDEQMMASRSWHWLSGRILGLLSTPIGGWARLPVDDEHERVVPIWRTRIQRQLMDTGTGG